MAEIFNRQKADKHTMNDGELLRELIQFSLGEIPEMIASLKKHAGTSNPCPPLAEISHKIKGAAGAVSAERLYRAAFELELQAKENRAESLEALVAEIETAFDEFRLCDQVSALVKAS